MTGVDICPEMIVEAQARKDLRCRFEVADAMDLPFLDKSFDVDHESEGRDASGAMLVARVVIP